MIEFVVVTLPFTCWHEGNLYLPFCLFAETRVASTKVPPACSSQDFANESDSHTFLFATRVRRGRVEMNDVFTSFLKSAYAMTCCPLRSVPTSTFEAVRQLFPEAFSTPVSSLVSSRVPGLLSQVATSFELLFTSSLRMGCCCCTSQLLFERNLGSWSWCCEPSE